MATAIEQLQSMQSLEENWDGYGAASPQANIIDLAKELASLIEAIVQKATSEPCTLHVNPTRVGGILIEWEDSAKQHEVELYPDRSISFLHFQKETGHIETRKFSPGPLAVVLPGFLQELRHLLAA